MKNVIYKIRNVINDKFYVGSTVDSRKRFWAHRKALRLGNHDCVHLQRAWNKYGEDCFKFEIVEQINSKEELYPAEQKWLDEHYGKDHCYNVAAHADSPMRDASPEFRAKHAQIMRDYYSEHSHPREGMKHSPEVLDVMSRNRKGKHAGENHYRYGKTLDAETRKKIGDAQRGVKKGPRTYTPEGLLKAQENMRKHACKPEQSDFSSVLAKFPEEVRNKYNFENAVYTGALNRITGCKCTKHGEFSQYAAQFRKGRGCPECGAEQRAASKKKQMLEAWSNPEEREKMLKSRIKTVD